MKRVALAILAFAAGTQTWSQDLSGTISVKVIDEQGDPVPAATVKFDPPPGRVLLHVSPTCKTDATGSCTQGKLPLDTYVVRVNKPSQGYPDMSFRFYRHQSKEVVVELTPGHLNSDVVFKLGPKAATLKLIVVDDSTGAPVDNPAIILRNAADPNDFVGIGKTPDSTVLIPPDIDVQIDISADGYMSWRSAEHSDNSALASGGVLHLLAEERREMTVRMTRE